MESAAGSTKDFAFSVRMRTRRGGHHDDVSNPGAAVDGREAVLPIPTRRRTRP